MKLKDSRNALEIVDVIYLYLWVIRYWKKFFSIKGKKRRESGEDCEDRVSSSLISRLIFPETVTQLKIIVAD